jgi:lysozyme
MTPKGKSGIALSALMLVAAPLIVQYEGNVTHTYADVNGVATVCAGETGHDVTWGMQFTMQQCLARLDKRLAVEWSKFEPCIQRPITINQAAALSSWEWNVGVTAACGSSLMRKLNAGEPPAVWCAELLRWTYSGGRQLKGLVTRRQGEYAICVKP